MAKAHVPDRVHVDDGDVHRSAHSTSLPKVRSSAVFLARHADEDENRAVRQADMGLEHG